MRSPFRILRSALRLDARARAAAWRALGWLAAARLALLVLPYATACRAFGALPPRRGRLPRLTPDECRRAVERAGRVLPSGCLARALAAESLLRREGHPAARSLGVRMGDGRQLHAHAWVESGGVTVAGGDDATHYHPLLPRREP